MKTTGIANLKAHLSRYVEHVKGGEEVVITERGRAVAKIVPLATEGGRDSRRRRLARAGLLQLGRARIRASMLKAPSGPPVGTSVVDALIGDRRHGR
ncbi:MAG TPA: type II toxin-antitoxin system prevent-host-death family antitoxin [Candidatus Limnocylindria bacterium]|nr:type II toxin-antitoxin system prevent-host-death family antitoxin [Candidatus Limnocylindria bacterium]